MAKKKTAEPVVIRGSHSTRTEYPNGRVEFVTHWDELKRDVEAALAEYEQSKTKGKSNGKVREVKPTNKNGKDTTGTTKRSTVGKDAGVSKTKAKSVDKPKNKPSKKPA